MRNRLLTSRPAVPVRPAATRPAPAAPVAKLVPAVPVRPAALTAAMAIPVAAPEVLAPEVATPWRRNDRAVAVLAVVLVGTDPPILEGGGTPAVRALAAATAAVEIPVAAVTGGGGGGGGDGGGGGNPGGGGPGNGNGNNPNSGNGGGNTNGNGPGSGNGGENNGNGGRAAAGMPVAVVPAIAVKLPRRWQRKLNHGLSTAGGKSVKRLLRRWLLQSVQLGPTALWRSTNGKSSATT